MYTVQCTLYSVQCPMYMEEGDEVQYCPVMMRNVTCNAFCGFEWSSMQMSNCAKCISDENCRNILYTYIEYTVYLYRIYCIPI